MRPFENLHCMYVYTTVSTGYVDINCFFKCEVTFLSLKKKWRLLAGKGGEGSGDHL
jgi:hypothetical protein